MASMHIAPRSEVFLENLNRCHIKSNLFNSGRLRNIKQNFLLELSSKWESTFHDKASQPCDEVKSVENIGTTNVDILSPLARKSKMRSVYGQPQVPLSNQLAGSPHNHCRSLDSLDTCDSGQSLGSNSTSLSDLRAFDNLKTTDSFTLGSDLETSVCSSENEHPSYKRCHSSISTSSGCSVESQEDMLSRESKHFMKLFVRKIFDNSSLISLEEKSKFGHHARIESGRIWFARYITKERNENKCVRESTFYSLAQYFAIVLFECAESDDFKPAKILMNMCFTYYHNQPNNRSWPVSCLANTKQYLYSVLRDQPIWRSIRFWNAAFFDAVQCERLTFFENGQHLIHNKQDLLDDLQFQANVTFGQLGTFTHNMYSFGLPKKLCFEFLRKQSTIANLTADQVKLLQDNIEAMYGCSN